MIFNSVRFFLFFTAVFILYYSLKEKTKAQNWLLCLSSYFFYGVANWKMIPLLFISTLAFYYIGIAIRQVKTEKASTWFKILGIFLGIGVLLYFKYFNFFIESFSDLFNYIGFKTNWHTFNIIMPVGISFFTFKLISYVIDIQREEIEPTKDFLTFATYIAFFPTILSGPIDRPKTFIPQLEKKRSFNHGLSVDGCRQILWGLFKKIVIADNIAIYVDNIWTGLPNTSGSTLLLAAVFYSFQVYADFSGYSDMAIGVGKILGFRITTNFRYPFFSVNIAEYWRKWHMSLTNWVTDYIFTPISFGLRRKGRFGIIIAVVISFLVIGLWHGANWTFVFFGLYQGVLFSILILSGVFSKTREVQTTNSNLPNLKDSGRMLFTFLLITLGNIIFRAQTIGLAFEYFKGIFKRDIISIPLLGLRNDYIPILTFIISLIIIEWLQRNKEFGLDINFIKSRPLRFSIYYLIIASIFLFGTQAEKFIYFQF